MMTRDPTKWLAESVLETRNLPKRTPKQLKHTNVYPEKSETIPADRIHDQAISSERGGFPKEHQDDILFL